MLIQAVVSTIKLNVVSTLVTYSWKHSSDACESSMQLQLHVLQPHSVARFKHETGLIANQYLRNSVGVMQARKLSAAALAPPLTACSKTSEVLHTFTMQNCEETNALAGAPPARKLSAAALAAALTLPVPPVVDRLDLLAAHITSVCYEVSFAAKTSILHPALWCAIAWSHLSVACNNDATTLLHL